MICMVYVFENELLLTTAETWNDAERLIKELQKDGHGTMEARNYIEPRPRENREYNWQPLPNPKFKSLRQVVGPTWVNITEEMRWR